MNTELRYVKILSSPFVVTMVHAVEQAMPMSKLIALVSLAVHFGRDGWSAIVNAVGLLN